MQGVPVLGRVTNPFTDKWWAKCLAWYGVTKPRKHKGAAIGLMTKPPFRCDDYLNKNFRSSLPQPVPYLTVDGSLWMSLSAMEIQSSELMIQRAKGIVWTAGLGLGYMPMRLAAKRAVKEVHVVEQDIRVIELFQRIHDRPYLKKIRIYHGDAHDVIKGRTADLCFMDTYQGMCADEVVTDGKFYQKKNKFKEYVFWCWELAIIWALQFGIMKTYQVPSYVMKFFWKWKNTSLYQNGREQVPLLHRGYTLANLAKEPLDRKWTKAAVNHAITINYT